MERHAPLDGMPEHKKSRRVVEAEAKKRDEEEALEREKESRKREHEARASDIDPLTGKPAGGYWLNVNYVGYRVTQAKNRDAENMMCIYDCRTTIGMSQQVVIWLCPEYPRHSRAYKEVETWYNRRGINVPSSAQEAVAISRQYRKPRQIKVIPDGPWYRIIEEVF